jgi:hypothetical protein
MDTTDIATTMATFMAIPTGHTWIAAGTGTMSTARSTSPAATIPTMGMVITTTTTHRGGIIGKGLSYTPLLSSRGGGI